MKKILIPVDFSEYSKRAVEEGKELAKVYKSDIVLLTVIPNRMIGDKYSRFQVDKNISQSMTSQERDNAEKMLKEYKEELDEVGINVTILIREGFPADEIVDYANSENEIDFVIMGSHGIGSTIARTILGSVTSKVLHYIGKPVLVTR